MKVDLKKILLVPFLCMFLSNAWGHESLFETRSHQLKKIYVSPDQVEVTDNGILFYSEFGEDPILGKLISYDENGLYFEFVLAYCPIITHGPKCRDCGGCSMSNCSCRCGCREGVPW